MSMFIVNGMSFLSPSAGGNAFMYTTQVYTKICTYVMSIYNCMYPC